MVVLVLIVGAIYYLNSMKTSPTASQGPIAIPLTVPASSTPAIAVQTTQDRITKKSMLYPRALDISTPDGFINANPFSLKDLVGNKVILLDFWAYSCINCQRTIPYLNAWYRKYKDEGLEIVGIHTPEFDFEKQYDNVAAAVKKFGIQYPVVLDNDYST
ncbi:MAG: redoxin domain-containing protein, partial [Patescibacteria group bacterium]|nr:redoxin domain-containing protein [Patescibacteria group bacterium]